jgi:hypothetical protein
LLAAELHLAAAGALRSSSSSSGPAAEAPAAAPRPDPFLLLLALLMRSCSPSAALQVLAALGSAPAARYIWPGLGGSSSSGGSMARLCQVAEWVLAQEAPDVLAALSSCGLPPAGLFQGWLGSSWLGLLEPAEAAQCSVVLPALLGPDYSVYVCVALLVRQRAQVLRAARQGDLAVLMTGWRPGRAAGGWRGLASLVPQLEALQRGYRQQVVGALFG